jgi:hypothetical protein
VVPAGDEVVTAEEVGSVVEGTLGAAFREGACGALVVAAVADVSAGNRTAEVALVVVVPAAVTLAGEEVTSKPGFCAAYPARLAVRTPARASTAIPAPAAAGTRGSGTIRRRRTTP